MHYLTGYTVHCSAGQTVHLITSLAKEVMFLVVIVCEFVFQKVMNRLG